MSVKNRTIGLYAGSFDPMTKGHLDVLSKALQTFDTVFVSIGINPKKVRLFDTLRAANLIKSSINEHFGYSDSDWIKIGFEPGKNKFEYKTNDDRIMVTTYPNQSLIAYANEVGATHIVRGLRQASDFNDEFTLTGVAGHLDESIIFTHFICREEFLHISSSTARELASLREDISWLVTPSVEQALKGAY